MKKLLLALSIAVVAIGLGNAENLPPLKTAARISTSMPSKSATNKQTNKQTNKSALLQPSRPA